MKRTIVAALAAIGILTGASNQAVAQVERGSFMIDPYVGAPTWNVWWSSVVDVDNIADYKTVGGPVSYGGRLEYMLADNFGLGIDCNYAAAGFQGRDYNPGDTVSTLQDFKFKSQRLRVMLRLNLHIVQTENLDVYVGIGAGYRRVTRNITWNGVDDPNSSYGGLLSGSVQPIAIRLAFGGRYYFHPNIGANFEVGISGGGVIQAGISAKI